MANKTPFEKFEDFYPRSPCGERLKRLRWLIDFIIFLSTLSLRRATSNFTQKKHPLTISIHALLAESDDYIIDYAIDAINISIHALLAESDESIGTLGTVNVNFYPRSPCGERRINKIDTIFITRFLSTLSLRRAT